MAPTKRGEGKVKKGGKVASRRKGSTKKVGAKKRGEVPREHWGEDGRCRRKGFEGRQNALSKGIARKTALDNVGARRRRHEKEDQK